MFRSDCEEISVRVSSRCTHMCQIQASQNWLIILHRMCNTGSAAQMHVVFYATWCRNYVAGIECKYSSHSIGDTVVLYVRCRTWFKYKISRYIHISIVTINMLKSYPYFLSLFLCKYLIIFRFIPVLSKIISIERWIFGIYISFFLFIFLLLNCAKIHYIVLKTCNLRRLSIPYGYDCPKLIYFPRRVIDRR